MCEQFCTNDSQMFTKNIPKWEKYLYVCNNKWHEVFVSENLSRCQTVLSIVHHAEEKEKWKCLYKHWSKIQSSSHLHHNIRDFNY